MPRVIPQLSVHRVDALPAAGESAGQFRRTAAGLFWSDGADWTQLGAPGGGGLHVGETPPASPAVGDRWFNGRFYTYVDGGWLLETGTSWGDIEGLITDQPDLADALDGKAPDHQPGDVLVTARDPGAGWLEQGGVYAQADYPEAFAAIGLIGDGVPGTSWVSSPPTTALPANPVSITRVRDDALLAVAGNEIYRSTDYGLNWALVASPAGLKTTIEALDDDVVLVGGNNGFLLRSTDAGLTWTQVSGLPSATVAAFVVLNPARVLALFSTNAAIRLSTDGGLSWTSPSGAPTLAQSGGVALSPSVVVVTLASSSINIYRSTNGGASFSAVAHGGTSASFHAGVSFGDGFGSIFQVSGSPAPLRTTDYGLTWTPATWSGSPGTIYAAFSPGKDSGVVLGGSRWLFTGDRGASWGEVSSRINSAVGAGHAPSRFAFAAGTSGQQRIALPDYNYDPETHFRVPAIELAQPWLKSYIKA